MTEPHVEEIRPVPEPLEACARFADQPHCLLLESAPGYGRLARHSFLSADPFLVVRAKGTHLEEIEVDGVARSVGDPFEAVRRRLQQYVSETVPGLPPFQGGAAGYFAYDLCHHLERLPAPRYDDLGLADMDVGFYDWVLAWDHDADRAWLISTGFPETDGARRERRAADRLHAVKKRLSGPPARLTGPASTATPAAAEGPPECPVPRAPGVSSTFSREGYEAVVRRTIEYIFAGDIFQANLSQRLVATWRSHPFELYRRLRQVNPAPFAAYLGCAAASIVSASPERFLRLSDRQVETRPIKGTKPRGFTPEHDMLLDLCLRASEKDRAENVMIVDLLRNDLSRVCREHSVRVPELCVMEHYASVHHLVSTVVGQLRPRLDAVDLLRAAFPGGSVTGAPKVRAMEIIAELEPSRRSVYCGAIGYIGFDNTMDTSIVIRTFIVKPGRQAYFQVGGAVVADSEPRAEYEETLDKAQGLLAALEPSR